MGTQQTRTLAVAAAGTLLTLVAFTATLATINPTAVDLAADTAGRTWILSSMSIGLGAVLLSAGTLADDHGRRRVFVAGAIVLAAASVVAALAPGVLPFVLARVAQGVGGAALIASSLGLIAHAFPVGPARATASGVWGAAVGGGIALGPLLGAGSDRVVDWRAAHWVIAGGALILAVAAHRLVAESRAEHGRALDIPGTVLLAAGMSTLLAALILGRSGWTRPVVVALAIVAAVLLAAFVLVELRSRSAMLDLRLFAAPAFLAATAAAFATGAGVIALMSYLLGFAVTALGFSTLGSAWLMFGWSATSMVTALIARRIRVSGRMQLAIGLAAVGLGQLSLLGIDGGAGWPRLLPCLIATGVVSGVVNAALGREAVASVPAGRGSLGSGANNTARYVGSAIGVTVVAVLAARPAGAAEAELLAGWNHATIVTALVSFAGALLVLACRPRRVPDPAPAAVPVETAS
ncbi:MFS transporter [Nocardia terpenica]|uniref:MFS transporter n=1 Tax=Nocardia terpenica TaxID=455432 RepID=A0A164L9Z4_9NOCA|nr:MFS transporter [Nocardia terpenica]KZM72172.1 MFS transporter [Nocardia terpenica]NQE86687.1 MFS transporter [Nocardia terpenica]